MRLLSHQGINQEVKPLTQIPSKSEVKIVKIEGGEGIKSKSLALGLIPGMKIRILKSTSRGPVLVSIFEDTIMIGHGMAKKIFVK